MSVQLVLWPSRGREKRKKEFKNRKCEGVEERLLRW